MSPKTAGSSQSLRRAIAILRTVSTGPEEGMNLTDIAAANGLHVATCHRLLHALVAEGLVYAGTERRSYVLGAEMRRLGACAERQNKLERLFAPVLDAVARHTQDTVFLSVRSGSSAICLARKQGSYPVKTLVLDVGSIRPLGVGAGSLALLAGLGEAQADEMIALNAERYAAYNLSVAKVSELVRGTRASGYAVNAGLVIPEYSGVAVLLGGLPQEDPAAVSVAAVNSRMPPDRQADIARFIQAAWAASMGGGAA